MEVHFTCQAGETMTDELLSSIIQLENEIQEQLQIEHARVDAWLERSGKKNRNA